MTPKRHEQLRIFFRVQDHTRPPELAIELWEEIELLQTIVDKLPKYWRLVCGELVQDVPFEYGMKVYANWSPGEGFEKTPVAFTLDGCQMWDERGWSIKLRAVSGQQLNGMRHEVLVDKPTVFVSIEAALQAQENTNDRRHR